MQVNLDEYDLEVIKSWYHVLMNLVENNNQDKAVYDKLINHTRERSDSIDQC